MSKFKSHRAIIGSLVFLVVAIAALYVIPSASPALCSQEHSQCQFRREDVKRGNNKERACEQMKEYKCPDYETLCGAGATAGPPPDLTGKWTCTGICEAKCEKKVDADISMKDGVMTFTNECGSTSPGKFIKNNAAVMATGWSNLEATILEGGKKLDWGNDSFWEKKPEKPEPQP